MMHGNSYVILIVYRLQRPFMQQHQYIGRCATDPVHYPTRDLLGRLGLLKAGSHNLHYRHINDLNAEKNPMQHKHTDAPYSYAS